MKKFLIMPLFLLFINPAYVYAACTGSGTSVDPYVCNNWADLESTVEGLSGDDKHVQISGVTITNANSTITIPTDVDVEIIGAGTNSTFITGTGSPKFVINRASGNSYAVRISGIKFYSADAKGIWVQQTTVFGARSLNRYRIDNCEFYYHGGVFLSGNAYGVVDNCHFEDDSSMSVAGTQHLFCNGCTGTHNMNNLVCNDEAGSWVQGEGLDLGTGYFHFVEDCTLTYDSFPPTNNAMDGRAGSRLVLRYSTLTNMGFGFHDCADHNHRGDMAWEVYQTTWRATEDSFTFSGNRGGVGVVWGNNFQLSSEWDTPSAVFYEGNPHYRSSSQGNWGECDDDGDKFCTLDTNLNVMKPCTDNGDCTTGHEDDICVAIDGDSDGTGYPCRDQHGWYGLGAQSHHPVVAWDNLECFTGPDCTPTSPSPFGMNLSGDGTWIKWERDVIDDVSGSSDQPVCEDGTDNDGDGDTDASDSDCSTYWDSTNDQLTGYTAYTYPHPMRDDSGVTIYLSSSDLAGSEVGPDTTSFTLTCPSCDGDETVDFTYGGTATEDTDYTDDGDGTIEFSGTTPITITQTPQGDVACEGEESIVIVFTNAVNATFTGTSSIEAALTDDTANDCAPALGVEVTYEGTGNAPGITYDSAGVSPVYF